MAEPVFHVDFDRPENLVFNRARMRRAFIEIGRVHMRDARRLVMRRGVSAPGEDPGYQTGRLARSIGYYVPRASSKRPGLMVKIAPNQKKGEGNRLIEGDFYPAFLFYGVRRAAYGMSKQDKRQKRHHKSGEWRIAPRNNFMVEVLNNRKDWTRYILKKALRKSLRPPRVKRVKT